jgi:NTE family protein
MEMKPRVAIACQGGGSHAAFTAGVLTRLLAPDSLERFELAALSGTSGGAMCAALAWAGLIAGGAEDARRRLAGFWSDLEAKEPVDAAMNFWSVWFSRLPAMLEASPYAFEPLAEDALRGLLKKHLQLEGLPAIRPSTPELLIGATNILSGDRTVFEGRALTYDELMASAAVPPLFRAVKADGGLYWDGLFSTNPPVREFTDLPEIPDEIWVVQINPQRRKEEPKSVRDIVDRRNELAGNLSLAQELYFIDRINGLRAEYEALRGKYKHITVRVVELDWNLDYSSKLDRRPGFIRGLIEYGKERAERFFSDKKSLWPRAESLPPKSVRAAAAAPAAIPEVSRPKVPA